MTELHDPRVRAAVRDFLDEPLPVLAGDWDDVLSQSQSRRRVGRPRAARRGVLGLVLAGAGALAAIVVMSIVAINLTKRDATNDPALAPARVGWGMIVTVRVHPDSGVSVDDATSDAIRALMQRARERDIAGLTITSPKPGLVDVRVPGAENVSQVSELVGFERLSIYGESQVVARGATLTDFRPHAVAPGGADVVHYMHARLRGATVQTASRTKALRTIRERDNAAVLAFPSDLQIIRQQQGYLLVKGPPVVRPGEITFQPNPGTPAPPINQAMPSPRPGTVHLTPDATSKINDLQGDALLVTDGRLVPGYPGLVMATRPFAEVASGDVRDVNGINGTGMLSVTLSTVPLRARLEYVARRAYGGTPTPPRGEPYTPTASQKYLQGPGTFRRVMSPMTPLGRVDVVVRHNDRNDVLYLLDPKDGSLINPLGTPCPAGLGAAPIAECTGGVWGPELRRWLMAGRANTNVRSAEVRYPSGRTIRGTVKNGWYVVVHQAPSRTHETAGQAPVVVRDAEGEVIATSRPQSTPIP